MATWCQGARHGVHLLVHVHVQVCTLLVTRRRQGIKVQDKQVNPVVVVVVVVAVGSLQLHQRRVIRGYRLGRVPIMSTWVESGNEE